MTKSTALAPMHGGEPYSEEGQRLAPHPSKVDDLALARQTPIGRIVLADDSEFYRLAGAAGVNPAALVLELASVVARKPGILKCRPESVIAFMLDAGKLRLTIGRGIYPVPIKGSLEGWVGYKGAKELACRGGAIRDAWAQVVYEGDQFEFEMAPIPTVHRHVFGPNKGDMKKASAVYCTLLYPGGRTRARVFERAKIESYRNRNSSWRNTDSPWQTAEEEMWMAKAILHTVGDLPHSSPEVAHLRNLLEREESLDPAREVQPAPDAAALPAGSQEQEAEDLPAEPADEQEPDAMSVGKAGAITVTLQGGETRMLAELRNSGLESVRSWARKKLEADTENPSLARIAAGCTVLLDARASGVLREPPKKAAA